MVQSPGSHKGPDPSVILVMPRCFLATVWQDETQERGNFTCFSRGYSLNIGCQVFDEITKMNCFPYFFLNRITVQLPKPQFKKKNSLDSKYRVINYYLTFFFFFGDDRVAVVWPPGYLHLILKFALDFSLCHQLSWGNGWGAVGPAVCKRR